MNSSVLADTVATAPQHDAAAERWTAHPHTLRTVPWEREAADRFSERMLSRDKPFPCVFGVDALRKGTLRFAFIDDTPLRSGHLAAALTEFVHDAPALGRRTSLVAFFRPSDVERTMDSYRKEFWGLLQDLHDQDVHEWPESIPTDTEHPTWEFSFAGMPMFVVANTPAHRQRQSRAFDCLAVTFQPRFVFEGIGEDTVQGRNARNIIRGRLADYDDVPTTPLLGSFGTEGNKEWVQYFLEDDNTPPEQDRPRCPLHIAQNREAAPDAARDSPEDAAGDAVQNTGADFQEDVR